MSERGEPLAENELVIIRDPEGRKYLRRLRPGGQLVLKDGKVEFDRLVGLPPGAEILTSTGQTLLVHRPSARDYIMKMKRKSNIIYPKELGIILVWADIFAGARVMTAGVGSGALVVGLLRIMGESGWLFGYDVRDDMLQFARDNIREFYGRLPTNVVLRQVDVYESVPDLQLDRVILDLPEPWLALDALVEPLVPGGLLLCYLPTITQVERLQRELEAHHAYWYLETLEILLRRWRVCSPSVRPEHQMVGHTGFLVLAQRAQRSCPKEG